MTTQYRDGMIAALVVAASVYVCKYALGSGGDKKLSYEELETRFYRCQAAALRLETDLAYIDERTGVDRRSGRGHRENLVTGEDGDEPEEDDHYTHEMFPPTAIELRGETGSQCILVVVLLIDEGHSPPTARKMQSRMWRPAAGGGGGMNVEISGGGPAFFGFCAPRQRG
jgi:hypothetical protein